MSIATEEPQSHPFAPIVSIEVKRLFGRYSYRIGGSEGQTEALTKAFMVYGDNGSGKTTILKMLFHLLSPARNRGHRTFLAKVPFEFFEVCFSNRRTISVKRASHNLTGAYTITVLGNARVEADAYFQADADLIVRAPTREDDENQEKVLDLVTSLGIDFYYLSDDREMYSDKLPDEEDVVSVTTGRWVTTSLRSARPEYFPQPRGGGLQEAMERAAEWIRQQVLTGANAGSLSANAIYTDVVRRIATSPAESSGTAPTELNSLSNRLDALSKRASEFSRFGLVAPMETADLSKYLRAARPETAGILSNIIEPYMDGIEARLTALQSIHEVLTTFVNTVNSFYTDKELVFDLGRGVRIVSGKEILHPDSLSSGEKQLLLLLCDALAARDQASIFIIDEPELSLNLKWQRKLIDALLDCTRGSSIQYVLATHSVELLAGHRDHVVRLRNRQN